ncbi:hypothetical protein [Bremerella cremea]|uniref:hypothetical protein n=1 Tax=Bremerella cremea TaxID=1031537 RepID=UPI0031EAAF09
MGLVLQLLFWLAMIFFLLAFKVGEAFVRAALATAMFLKEIGSLGFSKAELRYRQSLQEAFQRPWNDSTRAVRRSPIFFLVPLVLILTFATIFIGWRIADDWQKSKIADTRAQIERIADEALADVVAEGEEIQAGKLPEIDAWKHHLVLQRSDVLNGTKLVVLSFGPDGKPGSHDDLTTTRFHKKELKEIAGDLAGRSKDAIKSKWNKLLGKEEEPVEPEESPAENAVILNLGEDDSKPTISLKLKFGSSPTKDD